MTIKVKWQVEDGYVGKSRPQETKFNPLNAVDSLEEWEALSREEQEELVWEAVQEDFEQKIGFGIDDFGF